MGTGISTAAPTAQPTMFEIVQELWENRFTTVSYTHLMRAVVEQAVVPAARIGCGGGMEGGGLDQGPVSYTHLALAHEPGKRVGGAEGEHVVADDAQLAFQAGEEPVGLGHR